MTLVLLSCQFEELNHSCLELIMVNAFLCSGYLHSIITFKSYHHLVLKVGVDLLESFNSVFLLHLYLQALLAHLYFSEALSILLCSFSISRVLLLITCCWSAFQWWASDEALSFVLLTQTIFTLEDRLCLTFPPVAVHLYCLGQDDFLSRPQGQILSSNFKGIIIIEI